MALSKPIMKALSFYLSQMYEHPLRTSALTCSVIALDGNATYQRLAGIKPFDLRSVLAFGVFGLLFSGPAQHYFYSFLERAVPDEASFTILKKLFLERVIFFPLCQVIV